MRFQIKFLLLFLFLSTFSLQAQYKPSKNYTTADGLPNNAVRSLYLDKNADLWIGTENGISRFLNGTFYNISESNGLGHNSCWDIAQDANGNMWFASYGGGVSKFDGTKFTVFTVKNGLPANKTRKVFPFKNKVYVGTEQGISIIDINSNKVVTPKTPIKKEDFISLSFIIFEQEVYFTTVYEGFYKIDESCEVPKIIPVVLHKNTYSLGLFGTTLYSSNEGFIDKFDMANIMNGDVSSVKFGQSMVWQYAKDKRNAIYAAAWGVYNPDGGLFRIEKDNMIAISDYFGIDSKILLNVVYDKNKDILYVGSNDKGIYEVRLDKMIDYDAFENKSVIDFAFFESQKMILHNKGISIFNASNKVLKTVSLADFKKVETDFVSKNKDKIATKYRESRDFELNYNIPANGIEFYEMVKHHNSFWVSTNIGIFEINFQGKIIAYVPKHSLKIGFTTDNKFIETITYAGVYLYDDVYKLKGRHYSKFEEKTPQYIVKILNHSDRTYLLSVFNGLYVYKNNEFHSYLAEGIWKEKKFKHITVNPKGQLILSAEFGDVFIVDDSKSFKILKTISKKEIIGNTIMFLETYNDYILIGTEKGINIYKDGRIQLVDKQLGLNDCAITTSKIFKKQLWLGTKKGFYTIDLDKLTANKNTVSSIEIRAITINSKPLESSKFRWFSYNSNQLVCDYQHNTIALDFLPKGHSFSDKLKFRYRLKKKNRWSPYSEKPFVYLSYLPNDTYHLEIEVLDLNAGKISRFDVLKIIIQPPFWKTGWFYGLEGILLIFSATFIIIRIKKRAKQKAETENRIAKAKLEALLSQMNPHFTFNALNTIQSFVFNKDAHNSAIYISEVARLMRQTLDNSAKQTITIEDEIEYLETYIAIDNQRFDNRIQYKILVDDDIDIAETKIPTMLLQPFVENIFKHAFDKEYPNPTFKIEFVLLEKKLLQILISDNGKGNTINTKTHISRGIAIANERLQIMQPTNVDPIKIDFSKKGTTVNIRLII
jgi:hypothetical protein